MLARPIVSGRAGPCTEGAAHHLFAPDRIQEIRNGGGLKSLKRGGWTCALRRLNSCNGCSGKALRRLGVGHH